MGRILGISYNDETAACDNNRSPLNEGDFVYIYGLSIIAQCAGLSDFDSFGIDTHYTKIP